MVVDCVLALVDAGVVLDLVGRAAGYVADLLEAEIDRIVHPDVNRMAQNRVQGLGHIEIAHATAGNARRAGAGSRLVEQDDILAAALAPGFELHGEMPGGAEAMNGQRQ